LARGTPEASITARNGEPQLAAAGQTQLESSPAAVWEQGFFCIEFCQQLRDDSAHSWSVVHPRHQMHHDLLCCDFQHPAALCQLSELIMIVAVIVIGLLEGSQRRVEHVAGGSHESCPSSASCPDPAAPSAPRSGVPGVTR